MLIYAKMGIHSHFPKTAIFTIPSMCANPISLILDLDAHLVPQSAYNAINPHSAISVKIIISQTVEISVKVRKSINFLRM